MKLVVERIKVVVEPSAVVSLAVCLFNENFRCLVEREAGDEGWEYNSREDSRVVQRQQ